MEKKDVPILAEMLGSVGHLIDALWRIDHGGKPITEEEFKQICEEAESALAKVPQKG